MKYVTKENFQQYDSSLKDYIDDVFTQDLSSYGVFWKPNVADPHLTRVGNMTYHKSLPIQNNMKGCIAQMKDGAKIIYYLNPTDWRFRELPTILYNKEVSTTITDDVFSDLKYDQQYVKINNIVCQVININTSTKTATIKPESTLEAGTYDIELGSCTNGYDGEVMVEVPEFWIKSWDTNTRREVRITPTYIDDSWEHQPHILVSPYHDTVLNAVPTNMGYLSTLEVNSAVSICNINDYCRGGTNDTSYDQYITTDRFKSMLSKPRVCINRATMRTYSRKSGKEILNYLQYKRVMYWLYVIEYANFNSQEEFKEELTKEGFRQGGLGKGITMCTQQQIALYNKQTPITPNGYTNEFGNRTSIKAITMPAINSSEPTSLTQYVPRWHGIENSFGDIQTMLDGIIINSFSISENGNDYNEIYITDDPLLYSDSDYSKMKKVYIQLNQTGYIKEWNLGNTAEIMPRLWQSSATRYKCDWNYYANDTALEVLCVNGDATININAGIGTQLYYIHVKESTNYIGFRSSCIIK